MKKIIGILLLATLTIFFSCKQHDTFSNVDYHSSNDLKQLNELTIHSQWYDYVSLLVHPKLFILNGISNVFYYNKQY